MTGPAVGPLTQPLATVRLVLDGDGDTDTALAALDLIEQHATQLEQAVERLNDLMVAQGKHLLGRAKAAEARATQQEQALQQIASLHIPDKRRSPAWADIARAALSDHNNTP